MSPSRGQYDLVVIGAGPAGGHAALAAAQRGLSVALLDEQRAPGGQVWRQPWREGKAADPEAAAGRRLREALLRSGVDLLMHARVWSVSPGFRVDAVGPDGAFAITAPRLVAATGAYERVIPFEGWTLPGVMGLAAATILLKAEHRLPGRRVVVAGRGPLLAAVAAGILRQGGEVAAVVDAAGSGAWLSRLSALVTRPWLLTRGAGWVGTILRAGVPILPGRRIVAASGDGAVERVRVGQGHAGTVEFACDALVVGDGLTPGADIPKLLRAEMRYDPGLGGWVPVVSERFETSLAGLYAIGDGAGIRGADTAAAIGTYVGQVVAEDGTDAPRRAMGRALRRTAQFRRAIAASMTVEPSEWAVVGPDTIVCRCEDVTRSDIERAVDDGASDVNQLKHFTRCGMGPCQGRMCGETVQALLALRTGSPREAIGYWTPRPPLRPLPIDELIGLFTYDDIPIPKAAPL